MLLRFGDFSAVQRWKGRPDYRATLRVSIPFTAIDKSPGTRSWRDEEKPRTHIPANSRAERTSCMSSA